MYLTVFWPPQHHWFNLISVFAESFFLSISSLPDWKTEQWKKKKQLYTLPGTNVWYPIHPGSCKDEFPAFSNLMGDTFSEPNISQNNQIWKLKYIFQTCIFGGLWSICEGFISPGHAGRLHGKIPEPLDVVCTFLMTGVGRGERYAPYTNSSQDNPTVLRIACIVIQIKTRGNLNKTNSQMHFL